MAEMGSQAVGDISLSLMAVSRPSTLGSGLSGTGPENAVIFSLRETRRRYVPSSKRFHEFSPSVPSARQSRIGVDGASGK